MKKNNITVIPMKFFTPQFDHSERESREGEREESERERERERAWEREGPERVGEAFVGVLVGARVYFLCKHLLKTMGGGNAQKSAKARADNLKKNAKNKNTGGGAQGAAARSGANAQAALEAAQAERAAKKAAKEAKAAKKG